MVATLFDLDGVLVDTEGVHLAAFRDVLAPHGIAITDEAYTARYLGFDDAGVFRAVLADAGLPVRDSDVRVLIEAKKPAFLKRIQGGLRIFPGAAALVRRRAGKGPVAVVSGALAHEIEMALVGMGVRQCVGFVVSAEQVASGKPSPDGYEQAMRKLLGSHGVRETDAVVIEDSVSGVLAAKAAGLRCAAVTHSYRAEELVAAGADAVVSSLAELTDDVLDGPFA